MINELKGLGSGLVKFAKRVLKFKHDNAGHIELNGDKEVHCLTTAITGNVTTTSAPVGSIGVTSHATGRSSIFVSDGTKWQTHLAITPIEAAANVPALTDSSGGATANGTIEAITNAKAGFINHGAVAAPTTSGLITQKDLNGVADAATCTVLPAPFKTPRNVVLNITVGNTSILTYSITVAGLAPDGTVISETFTQVQGLTPAGSKIFASLTSVTINSITGDGAGDTLDVGMGAKLGLPLPYGSTGLVIQKLAVDGVIEAASATDQTNNSFTPTTAANGAKIFTVWFSYADPGVTLVKNAIAELAATLNDLLEAIKDNAVMEADD